MLPLALANIASLKNIYRFHSLQAVHSLSFGLPLTFILTTSKTKDVNFFKTILRFSFTTELPL